MSCSSLALGASYGWDSETTAKAAIAHLRESSSRMNKCAKAQLIQNGSLRVIPNGLKIAGYIPVLNVIAGIFAIVFADHAVTAVEEGAFDGRIRPWQGRGIAMILFGPLLFIADLVVYILRLKASNKYIQDHPKQMEIFNTDHEHRPGHWPGSRAICSHPVVYAAEVIYQQQAS